ncbi:IS3 family transposase [Nonomuraea sp. NPDC003707]
MTLAKYELIDAEKACHSIVKMCAWLGVSRSGYYEWRERPASATAQRRMLLAVLVAEIFAGSHETYGYRRVHAALLRRGEHCSAELVRALMREQGLVPAQVRAFRPATTIQGDFRGIPDLVGRDFTATRPGTKLVGSGSRREFHPPAPIEPCVIVPHYTALATLITRTRGSIASERTSSGIAA